MNTDDVAIVLGENSHDIAKLCTSGKINKASKCKPIRFDKVGELTDEERKGSGEDKLAGFYYGVKIAVPNTLNFAAIHNVNLEYRQPRIGTDWCRLTDFIGYAHDAHFNPYGQIPPWTISSVERFGVGAYYDASNSIGVDLNMGGDWGDLGTYYPCVLLSNAKSESNFPNPLLARALVTDLGTQYGPSAFKRNGSWVSQWYVPFEAASSDNSTKSKFNSLMTLGTGVNEKTVTMTIFFAKGNAINDFKNKWLDVSAYTLSTQDQVLVCPEAIAAQVTLKRPQGEGIIINSVRVNNKNVDVNVQWSSPTAGATYTVTLTIRKGTELIRTQSRNFTATSANPSGMIVFTFDDPQPQLNAGYYTYTWTTVTNSTQTSYGNGSFTVDSGGNGSGYTDIKGDSAT